MGIRPGGQPQCGDSDIWEGPLLDEAGAGLRCGIWSFPDSPAVNHRWHSSTNRAVAPPSIVVLSAVIAQLTEMIQTSDERHLRPRQLSVPGQGVVLAQPSGR